jgi:hypothetical protein
MAQGDQHVTDTSVATCAGHSPSGWRSFRKQRTVNLRTVHYRSEQPYAALTVDCPLKWPAGGVEDRQDPSTSEFGDGDQRSGAGAVNELPLSEFEEDQPA